MSFDVVVIGGGSTGVFTALDLALRGFKVAVFERGSLCSGTTGRFHGLLHSGARYAVSDLEAARECIQENQVLSKIAPHTVVNTGGLFIALGREEEAYQKELVQGCRSAGIPFREVGDQEARELEPHLNPKVRSALWVPDKVVYAHDLILSAALTAIEQGAEVYTYREVVGFQVAQGTVKGVRVQDKLRGEVRAVEATLVINAAGPWVGQVARLAGIRLEILPVAGVMGVVGARLANHVLNRMRAPSDGDILVPYTSAVSIIGTTATLLEDPDRLSIEPEDLELLMEEGAALVPQLRKLGFTRAYASVRPLIKPPEGSAGRATSRSFIVLDHAEMGVDGFISVVGGKLTTARLMGERVADLACRKLGVKARCRSKETLLVGGFTGTRALAQLLERVAGQALTRGLLATIGSIDEERFLPAIRLLLLQARSGCVEDEASRSF